MLGKCDSERTRVIGRSWSLAIFDGARCEYAPGSTRPGLTCTASSLAETSRGNAAVSDEATRLSQGLLTILMLQEWGHICPRVYKAGPALTKGRGFGCSRV